MIPDIIVICVALILSIISILLFIENKFKLGWPLLLTGLSLGVWFAYAQIQPTPVRRTVICELQTIRTGTQLYQIVKEGEVIYNITQEKGQIYRDESVKVKLEFLGGSVCGMYMIGGMSPKPRITIIEHAEKD